MKNLIAELLIKLADKEQESREMVAQVEALEIVVTAMLRHMNQQEQTRIISHIETALEGANTRSGVNVEDAEILQQYIEKLLRHPRV